MSVGVIGLIFIGFIGLIFGLFMIMANRSDKNTVANVAANKGTKQETKKSVSEGNIPRKDIFKFMEFDKIVDDMIVQDNESRYSVVVQCNGINYDLMSDVEQLAIEEGFITFLNTLKFPVQIYVQARAIDLKGSMETYRNGLSELNAKYLDASDKYAKVVKDISSTDRQINDALLVKSKFENMLEYATDITKYVEKLSMNKYLLQRKFYIIFSYYKNEISASDSFSKQELQELCHRELYTRAQSIISALASCSVSAKVLNSNDLAELLYISYNRDDEKIIDIKSALDSGFYRLYSTGKDVYDKKQELMDKEIKEEALRRVKEATLELSAMKEVKTANELVEEYEDQVDREAIGIVKELDIDDKTKKELTNVIVENHVVGVQARKAAREEITPSLDEESKTESEDLDKDKEDFEVEKGNVEQKEKVSDSDSIV